RRDEREPRAYRRRRREPRDVDGETADRQRPAARAAGAEEQMRHFLEAGSDQTRHPQDFAFVHLEPDTGDARAREVLDPYADLLLREIRVTDLGKRCELP